MSLCGRLKNILPFWDSWSNLVLVQTWTIWSNFLIFNHSGDSISFGGCRTGRQPVHRRAQESEFAVHRAAHQRRPGSQTHRDTRRTSTSCSIHSHQLSARLSHSSTYSVSIWNFHKNHLKRALVINETVSSSLNRILSGNCCLVTCLIIYDLIINFFQEVDL